MLQHRIKTGVFKTNIKGLNLQMYSLTSMSADGCCPEKNDAFPSFTGRFVVQAGVISGEASRRGSDARSVGFEGVSPLHAICRFPLYRTEMKVIGFSRTEIPGPGIRCNRRETPVERSVSRRTGRYRQTLDCNSNAYVLNKIISVWDSLHFTHRIQ